MLFASGGRRPRAGCSERDELDSREANQQAAQVLSLTRKTEELLEEQKRTDGNWVRVAGLPRTLFRDVPDLPKATRHAASACCGARRGIDASEGPRTASRLEDRRSAIALLRDATGLQISERAIDGYLRRHSLKFAWRKAGGRLILNAFKT